ncbi:MAG: hypothetical protein KAI77_00775 [Gammaproteobacteria bacterium]|nr:hypothetical protein [Gammaproteobacteria bacterium]
MTVKSTLKKIIKAVNKLFGQSEVVINSQIGHKVSNSGDTKNMREKEKDVYGEDRITQQKLYEKWAVKPSWHLKNQAIPLLLSMDPEKYSTSSRDEYSEQKYQDLWEHAQHCVEQGLLFVLNREHPADEWKAKPIDVYKWAAISRVELPLELSTLMEFVMMTLVSTENIDNDSLDNKKQNDITYDKDRERILGAALAMLVTYPERCKNKKGRVSAENILSLIDENESVLFGEEIPGLSPTAGIDLINKWIKTSA